MYRLLLPALALFVCIACGAAPTAPVSAPSGSVQRSPVARNEPTREVPTAAAGAASPTRSPAHTIPLASPTPLAEPIYVPMPTAEPPPPRPPTPIGGIHIPLSSAQQVIAALQAAGLTLTVKEEPTDSAQAHQDAGFEYMSASFLADGQRFDIGITVCPNKQACDDSYALGYKLALDGHAQIWRSPDGRVLCMTLPPAPEGITMTMKQVIEDR